MIEHERECSSSKRVHDFEQHSSSKRTKAVESNFTEQDGSSTTDNESKYSGSDNEESTLDRTDDDSGADDSEDHSDLSTDQSRYTSTVYNQTTQQQTSRPLSRYSSKLIKQFRYVYERSRRKTIDATQCANENLNENRTCRWQLSNTFNRSDLLNAGYAVLSDERFPFHSLCFMCGSMGHDLLYCNSCCQAYHSACLNEFERPYFYPTPDSWVCPNCTICNICGLSMNSPIISCSECRRCFHVSCLKQSKDEQHNPNASNPMWLCPLCIKCDCGQALVSTERNLVSLNKSLISQQSLMCTECLKNMKIIRSNKNEDIERCHLCTKFIEQFITKPKPLFSVSLIGNQSPQKVSNLLQCTRCKHRFHPKCDGYLNEDVTLLPYVNNVCTTMICSQCDGSESDKMKTALMNYKFQAVKSTTASIISTLQIMLSEESRLHAMKRYLSNLQQLHQSRNRSLNVHAFLNDLLIVVQRLLDNRDSRQWQAAIDNCLTQHCPWFKTSNFSSSNRTLLCSSVHPSASHANVVPSRCLFSPSADHSYALNNDRLFSQANAHQTNLLTSTDSLLRYIDNKLDEKDTFENLYQIDTRICQLCQAYAEYYSTTVARLISIGVNQWVHIGCLLPAYTKTLENPPYILHKIREVIHRCQTKLKCDRCLQMGASVQCYEENCHTYYHCLCIEEYYLKFDRSLQEKWGMVNGLLPNLTTLCAKHSAVKRKNELDGTDDAINLSKLKPIHLSSTVHADLSNTVIEFSPANLQLCIGSLQIHSLGNFQYLPDNDPNLTVYPNGYHASRLFWSTKHARRKTVYHLRIFVEQTYHQQQSNHRTIEYPLSNEQSHVEQLYEICEQYFSPFQKKVPRLKLNVSKSDHAQYASQLRSSLIKCSISKAVSNNITRPRDRVSNGNTVKSSETIAIDTKTLRNLVTSGSINLSRLTVALAQALRHADQPLSSTDVNEHGPIFSYYLSEQKHESMMEQNIEVLLDQLTQNTNLSESADDSSLSLHGQSISVTDSSTHMSETSMPQMDGNVDHCDDDRPSTPTSALNEKRCSDDNTTPSNLPAEKRRSTLSDELIERYQQWLRSKFGRAKFTITSDDGYDIASDDLDHAWSRVVSLVRACRDDMQLTHLPMSNEELNGHEIFGLTKPIVKIILNQIYQRSLSSSEQNTPPIVLPLSSSSKHKNANDLIKRKTNRSKSSTFNSRMNSYQRKMSQRQRFSWLSNPNRKPEYALNSFAIDDALTYARRILLEESSVRLRLYHLRYFSERALIVGSSAIHGCGLFTLIDLIEGQMIIEYTGEVIRPCLTDKREYENERKGFGCYMFTVDSMNVIDATHQGNKARFINHNCQPNCFAKTVQSDGTKHIVIYALRDISRGSELTYDYSFPEEDVKIPCHCGTNKCRNYLN